MRRHFYVALLVLHGVTGCGGSLPSKSTTAKHPHDLRNRNGAAASQRRYPVCCPATPDDESASQSSKGAPCERFAELQEEYANVTAKRVLVGKATYYSDRLSGQAMANGELYRPDCAHAAHRTLPFGTIVRVRPMKSRDCAKQSRAGCTGNDRSVVVRISDRGPFGNNGRIIDVSYSAARTLGLIREGVMDVQVEVLESPE